MALTTEIILAFLAIITSAGGGMVTAIVFLYKQLGNEQRMSELRERQCRSEVADLRSRIMTLQTMSEMAERYTGGASLTSGQITVDVKRGTIREWSPGATAILHWTQQEMLGQKIVKLIPDSVGGVAKDWRERHMTAMQDLVVNGRAPRRGPHRLIAQRQGGTLVRILAEYSGYKNDDGDYFAVATFKEQGSVGPTEYGGGIDLGAIGDINKAADPGS